MFMACVLAGAARAAEIDLFAHAGGIVEAAVDDVLSVSLRGNVSTGYVWERVDDDGSGVLVRMLGPVAATGAAKDDRPAVGGPTTALWRFRAQTPGETTLRLRYWRPWEKDSKQVREISWSVRVR
ncbi:MAG: protease inhibitor I42 family protein [Dokdonella sp.]|nr:protease inhibitor I42 family protein [Dokdonella sp.]